MMTSTWKAKKNNRKLHLNKHQGKVSLQKSLPRSPGQVPTIQALGEETSKYLLKLRFLNGLMEPWESGYWAWVMLSDSTSDLYRD